MSTLLVVDVLAQVEHRIRQLDKQAVQVRATDHLEATILGGRAVELAALQTWIYEKLAALVSVQLSKRELDVAREALAAEAAVTSWGDGDRETIEAVITKLEALGARGSL